MHSFVSRDLHLPPDPKILPDAHSKAGHCNKCKFCSTKDREDLPVQRYTKEEVGADLATVLVKMLRLTVAHVV
jgi:predicted metal-binding protein